MLDVEVARRTGRSFSSVWAKRRSLGRPPLAAVPGGVVPKYWSDEDVALLGTMPDVEVARRTWVTLWSVCMKRQALGRPPLVAAPAGIVPKYWSDEEDEIVRTLAPAEVARRTGRSIDAVYIRRRILGIAARRV